MNVFILSTGRCGSTTFIKACQHISNYSSEHESRCTKLGRQRLEYADNHIESDNRLSWVLGRLEQVYGNSAFYVHLSRDKQKTIESFSRRHEYGIMKAYKEGILMGAEEKQSITEIAADYIQTVESNIQSFLKDKSQKMIFNLENAKADFEVFWELIAAEGNFQLALAEWDRVYNRS